MSNALPSMSKNARNERRKLQAASFNAIGLAFFAFGFVQPVVIGEVTPTTAVKLAISAAIGYLLHRYALRLLQTLEE